MNDDIHKPSSLDILRDMDLGTELKVQEKDFGHVETAVEGYQIYKAPEVGKPHPENKNLISAGDNGWNWFDTVKECFVKDVMRITPEQAKDVFRMAAWLGGNEVFFQDDECIGIELPGKIINITTRVLSRNEIQEIFTGLVGSSVTSRVSNGDTVKFAFTVPWSSRKWHGITKYLRFRGNGTPTIGTNGASEGCTYTIRKLGDEPPTFESLNFTKYLEAYLFPKSGMVIFAGETNSGKTTAIAGIFRRIVSNEEGGVSATYENPVEFEYRGVKSKKYRIGQTDMSRSLGGCFATACEDAMRRDAETILIGEVLNEGTARGVVNLSQSGHAVYTTFHAGSPMDFFGRWLGLFPITEQDSIRDALISSVNIVICVRLLPTIAGGRFQIRGSLVLNDALRSRLRSCSQLNLISTIKDIYVEQGNTMRDHLRQNRDLFSRNTYKAFMHTFEGGENDAELVYPDVFEKSNSEEADFEEVT